MEGSTQGKDSASVADVSDDTAVLINTDTRIGPKLAPFNPAGGEVIEIALSLLALKDNDVLYDLGCGDGRLLIAACQQHPSIKAVGVEYDADLALKANNLVNESNLQHQISILHDNVLNVDFQANCTVLYIYLVPEGMRRLREQLVACLERGVRIVTYVFSIPDVEPSQVEVYKSSTKIYLYQKR